MMKSALVALLLPCAVAFSPLSHPVTVRQNAAFLQKAPVAPLHMLDDKLPGDIQQKVQELVDRFDLSAVTGSMSNIMDGELGERGEAYTAAQFALILFIAIGGIPILGDPLMLILGPGLALAGLALVALSVSDLGDALSPWPVVPSGASLKTGGIYGEVRHPMYAGLIALMVGISILTGSANRLLLTAALIYAVNVKTEKEEEELLKTFPEEYPEYMSAVPGKFFPARLLDELPWTN